MISIARRNLKIFFRDRTAVFFSLLGVIIIIGLYVLFLGDMMLKGLSDIENARFLMDSWIMAGMLAATSITTTMGAFGVMVDDRSNKALKDFSSSPLRRSSLTGGYILSSFAIGVVMSVVAFIFAEIYIIAYGGKILPFIAIIKVFGCILLSVLASSAMVYFIVSFFKSQSAFATASTVIGTLIGFLTGIYIPVGSLPGAVQMIVKVFPVSHAGSLFRQIMMESPIKESFGGAQADVVLDFKNSFGVVFSFGNHTVTWIENIIVLVATVVIFYGLSILNLSRKSK